MGNKDKQKLIEQRNRKLLRIRLWQGFKQMAAHPWKSLPLVALIVITNFCSNYEFQKMTEGVSPEMLAVSDVITPVMCALLFVSLFFGAVMLASVPREWSSVHSKLWFAFWQEEHFDSNDIPVLISRERIKGTDVVRREFFSPGIPLKEWNRRCEEIEHQMNSHLIEPFCYGGKDGNDRQRIVMVSVLGAAPKKRGELTDEL